MGGLATGWRRTFQELQSHPRRNHIKSHVWGKMFKIASVLWLWLGLQRGLQKLLHKIANTSLRLRIYSEICNFRPFTSNMEIYLFEVKGEKGRHFRSQYVGVERCLRICAPTFANHAVHAGIYSKTDNIFDILHQTLEFTCFFRGWACGCRKRPHHPVPSPPTFHDYL